VHQDLPEGFEPGQGDCRNQEGDAGAAFGLSVQARLAAWSDWARDLIASGVRA